MKLVIVESPKKCDTIAGYLGNEYHVVASKGHVRDLATCGKGGLGINIDKDFEATYVVSSDKRKIVDGLKSDVKKYDEVIIATDPDREGEAIGWHLTEVLSLDPNTTKRLEFHEITEDSIKEAIKNPRVLNMDLVSSQEARRIIDRIIGFKLSGLLTRKMRSPSAGRVQSATLKIICDHQKEINGFVPEEYWSLGVKVLDDNGKEINLTLEKIDGAKPKIDNKEQNVKILSRLEDKNVNFVKSSKKVRISESKPPFSTSTLQQEAYNTYKFSTTKTSQIAQKLYEGVELGNVHVGLITYIRTDTTNLSATFIKQANEFISDKFGSVYLGKAKVGKLSAGAQAAHESIRPTSVHRTPESVKQYLSNDEYKLYKLIYERAVASLMSNKTEDVTTYNFEKNGLTFKCEYVVTKFDGFERCFAYTPKEKEEISFGKSDNYQISKIENEQKFTEPPAPYNEAKIVKLMEEAGIGRPSTYASTISTLKLRKYVTSKSGVLTPTETGMRTSHVLDKYFPKFVNEKFTADMEQQLDLVESGNVSRLQVLKDFYYPFLEIYNDGAGKMYTDPDEVVGRKCPVCGKELVYKESKYGRFIACSSYPNCHYKEKEEKPLVYVGRNCPKCGKPLVERKNGKNTFVACSGYPSCRYVEGSENTNQVKEEPKLVGRKCPKCGHELIYKKGKTLFVGCSNFPKCKYIEKIQNKESK